jgi:hypothetical protein
MPAGLLESAPTKKQRAITGPPESFLRLSLRILVVCGSLAWAAAVQAEVSPVLPAIAPAAAVPVAPAAPATTAPTTTAGVPVPANTVVELEMVDSVSSRTSKPGDVFRLRLTAPLAIEGTELLPAGTPATGEVVHAAKSGFGGKPGELLLAARFIEAPQGRIKLRAGLGAAGQDNTKASIGVAIIAGAGIAGAVVGMAVRGKDLELDAGTRVSARIAADATFVPALPVSSPPQGVAP